MKVALVLDDSIDRPDGVQQYVLTLGAFLERAGHEVHYVCSDATRTDVTVHSLARNVGVTFNGNGLRIPLPTSRTMLREFLERERYDVIHVQIPHSPLFAARVVDEARRVQARTVRIVGTFHILPDGAVSEHGTRLLGRWLRGNLAKFDGFCAVSPPAREFAGRAFGIDPRVIPCPVDVTRFAREAAAATRAPGADGRLVVAFLGRLVERKGAVELIAALAALDPVVLARIEVRIGGKGPLMGSLTEAVARHGLGDTVTFAGFVAEEDKAGFYADADIAVFPATGGESFGIVLVEAMASGAGVVLAGA
ncbi:MAG: glycosyltransferase family 4 protein, partial [Demequina sp.]|uniref:glycosyltransferase family 4 protein n=1 Tax=Demequina sp. TaxID=2050685 RepID=UPI003A8C7539